jgi:large subunit ribosomal protein L24
MVRKHMKPQGERAGGVFSVESPIHVSNVNVVDPSTGKPTRLAFRRGEDGQRVRIAKRSGAEIPRPAELTVRKTARQAEASVLDTPVDEVGRATYEQPAWSSTERVAAD